MDAEKREYAPRRLTDVGFLFFPHVIKADGKFNPEKPRYKADISLLSEQAQPHIDYVMTDEKWGMPAAEALRDKAVADAKKAGKKFPAKKDPANADMVVPYADVNDEDGNPTGRIIIKVRGNDRYKDKKTGEVKFLQVKLFNSKGVELKGNARPKDVWSGSRARVNYTAFPYYNAATNEYGVSLRLEAVKIIELKSGGSGGPSASDMGGEEDGYEGDPMSEDESGTDETATPPGDLPGDDEF